MYVKCLIYGEISKVQALKIADTLEFNMKNANTVRSKKRKFLQHREIKLENGKQYSNIKLIYNFKR